MKLIEQIKRDREAGTPGPWDNTGTHGLPTEFGVYAPAGRSVCSTGSYNDGLAGTYFENCCNATRIARVPAMEEALLAAMDAMKLVFQASEILWNDGAEKGHGEANRLLSKAMAIHRESMEAGQ